MSDHSSSSIPVIDIGPLYGDDPTEAEATAERIRRASVDVGFFYIANHHVPRSLQDDVIAAAKQFFAKNDATKREILVNRAHRGYVPFGQTRLKADYEIDLKESFNFAFPFEAIDPEVRQNKPLIGLNQWPALGPQWRKTVEAYYHEVFLLGQVVLQGFALSLKLERHFFSRFYTKPLVRGRLLHYPPQQHGGGARYGAAPHTDYGCITILWQDDVGGLQVRHVDGFWIDAPPIEGTFVVNIGDMMARWSNDLFVSTPHRVINASGRERYSIPVFYDPDYDAIISCLPNCTSADNPPRYDPIRCGEYIAGRYDETYAYRSARSAGGITLPASTGDG